MKQLSKFTFFPLVLCILLSGCQTFIPKQANSEVPDSKNATPFKISYLTAADVNGGAYPDFKANYNKAFNVDLDDLISTKDHRPVKKQFIPLLAGLAVPAASAAVGAAFNFISQSISNEASTYQATFGNTISDDKYLTRGESSNYVQSYFGFEVTRLVDTEDGGTTNGFRLLCGIYHTADGQLFIVKPLTFQTLKAKAKVVDNGFWSWIALYPHLALKTGSQINSVVNFNFTGYYKDQKFALTAVPMGTFSFKFDGYDLANPKKLDWVSTNSIPQQTSGFLDSAPLSYDSSGKPVQTDHAGNVDLQVSVTESDASNVRANLASISQFANQEKSVINVLVTNEVGKVVGGSGP